MAASTRVTEVLSLSEGGLTEPWSGPAPEIAGYHIEGLLAQGGQAEVYGATRLSDGLGVVLKVLRSRADAPSYAVTTFRREVELLARAAGVPVLIDAEVARATQQENGGHVQGWFQAQPLFDWIAEVEPGAFGSTDPVD